MFPYSENAVRLDISTFKSYIKTLDEGIYTFDQVIPGILEKLPPEIHEKISAMVTDFYDYMPPFPETYELIKELKEKGYKIYLLSNATPRFFDRYLQRKRQQIWRIHLQKRYWR